MAILFIGLTILFTVVGQILVKRGTLSLGSAPESPAEMAAFVVRSAVQPEIVAGLLLAGAAAACWIVALSRSDLSFAYPFMALSIVLVLVLSERMLGESISVSRWVGVVIVCFGLVITARG